MDPFTQRMLERARARQEKIDQKLASSGQTVPKRKPLTENISVIKNPSPIRSPSRAKESVLSPKKSVRSESPAKVVSRRSSLQKSQNTVGTPQKSWDDVVVTKKEFSSPRGSVGRRNSDVSLEINITHRNDIKVDVQIEEVDAPMTVVYDTHGDSDSNVMIKEIEQESTKMPLEGENSEQKSEKAGLRTNFKSRLDRLGNLYSDEPNLSSPIHRTEQNFTAATPPKQQPRERPQDGKRKFGRLAALADQINNWEDDLTHHTYNPEPVKKNTKAENKHDKLDSSILDVSVHSIRDINNVLKKTPAKSAQPSKSTNSRQSTKPSVNECQRLQKQIVAELEDEGYRRVSAGKSRLVYDFTATENADPARQEPKRASTTPSAAPAPNMAAMVASAPPVNATVTKKPSLKKYRAPTPPSKTQHSDDADKDKENNVILPQETDDDASDCIQTKPEPADPKPAVEKGSPAAKRLAPKLNGNVDRSSVLSKAAMFEAGSPRNKDPAEMSLRERKALFEKNKGVAIIPKAPFGMAPSVKTLHGDNKVDKTRSQANAKTTPTKSNNSSTNNSRVNSKDNLADDNISQSSLGGGIKGKLAALFNKEQTISESTIANKFKQEREREMEMLQNRFNYKPAKETPELNNADSDDDQSDNDPSEKAPLMGSSVNLAAAAKKPEIIANVPKVTFDDKTREEPKDKEEKDKVVGSQPVKRRSSQDSPVVLSVLDDVKRIKVNNNKKDAVSNGIVMQQPSLYPHLSDIETDTSHTQDEYSDCGGSSTDERLNDRLNKSDNWADTSFGREVMNVVKKNNTSYKKAVRESDSDESQSACDSELDDMLDEALEHEDGPTPPKVNKDKRVTICENMLERSSDESVNAFDSELDDVLEEALQREDQASPPKIHKEEVTSEIAVVESGSYVSSACEFKLDILDIPPLLLQEDCTSLESNDVPLHGSVTSSSSFVYQEKAQFKSPQKPQPPQHSATPRVDRGSELVHSVSFYRRMQNASSTPTTPMRIVRHCSPEREIPPTPDEPAASVTTVRQRIKELQNEITKQQTVISQASQALNLCAATIEFSGSTEQAEGERLLLLATHRRQACLHEVQRLQVEGAGPAATAGMASLHINSLSVPLRRDYVRQLNADGAVGHHAVCLLKCRDRVLASSMQLTQPTTALLHFPDEIRMDGLTSDFKVTVEVYLLQASKEILPHEVKYHINNKKSNSKLLTPKSKVSELKAPRVQSPAGPHSVRSPQFQLHGYCIFALQQANRKSFTLNKVPCGSPLEGSVNIDIKARVRVPAPPEHAAFLTAFDDVSGLGAWHRRWVRLRPPTLAYWKYPDDVHKKLPIGDIDLNTVVSEKAIRAPRDLCARPNTILIESSVPAGLIVPDAGSLVYVKRPDGTLVRRHLLAADTPRDRDAWLESLNRALEYVRCCATDDE